VPLLVHRHFRRPWWEQAGRNDTDGEQCAE
jgi:hypothetical protein